MDPRRKGEKTKEPVQAGRAPGDPELSEEDRKALGIREGQPIREAADERREEELGLFRQCLERRGFSDGDIEFAIRKVLEVHCPSPIPGHIAGMGRPRLRAEIAFDLVCAAWDTEDPDEKKRAAELAVRLDPRCVDGHVILGNLALEEAIMVQERLSKMFGLLRPARGTMELRDRAVAREELQAVLQLQGMYYKALKIYTKAVRHGEKAVADQAVGALEKRGIFELDKELSTKRGAAGRRARLGAVIERMKKVDVWHELDNGPLVRAMVGKASVQFLMGDLEDALCTYERVLEMDPEDGNGARFAYRDLLRVLKRSKELTGLYKRYPDLKGQG
jgi:hypothetical protein